MIIANVGDIWRFIQPKWAAYSGRVSHYLIIEAKPHPRWGYLYLAMELESGKFIEDLLIDTANIQNYRAELVE